MNAMTDMFFAKSSRERKGRKERLTVRNTETGDLVIDETYHRPIKVMEFDPTGQYLVLVGEDFLDVRDTATGNLIDTRPIAMVKRLREIEPGSGRRLFTIKLETQYEGDSYTMIPIMDPGVAL